MARENGDVVAIVGNGSAAAECVMALRDGGYGGEIHLFTDNSWPVYNPMLTTYFVAGKIGFDGLFPYGGAAFFQQYGVKVHPDSPVVALDAAGKVVANRAGFDLKYDQCLVASGASPVLPRVEGIQSPRVFTMRTVDDAIRLKEALVEKPKRALVVGASMVGIKLVELFHGMGMDVCLADLAEQIFPLAAHPTCARMIEDRLLDRGVTLRLGAGIQKVEETPEGVQAYFGGGGASVEADLLMMCIGVRANVGFINRNQVEVKQGILVDEQMRASADGLYAAGDVAQGRELLSGGQQIIGLWANARYQGRTAGRNMAGRGKQFPGNIPHNITHFMGMDFVGIGNVRDYDRMEQRAEGNGLVQLFWRDGLLVGANLLDSYTEAGVIKNAMVKRAMQGGLTSLPPMPLLRARF